jgi:hypothetical protein
MLSVFSRSQACAKLIATTTNLKLSSQNNGGRPVPRKTTALIGQCYYSQIRSETNATPVSGSTK